MFKHRLDTLSGRRLQKSKKKKKTKAQSVTHLEEANHYTTQ